MLKVFLVEDEKVVREGIRDRIPWEEYGYKFVGEEGDGEMALPLIRKTKPDVLLTDIKMPFMDGLTLCKMVGEEFPKMKKVIISGYDDFEYAREAIEVGVDQYVLKPITRMKLRKVLLELKEKIEQDNQQDDDQVMLQKEMQEYEQFSRRRFFEKVFERKLSVKDIYDEAAKQDINLSGDCFNLAFLYIKEKNAIRDESQMQNFIRNQEEVLHFFMRHPQYVLFRWNVNCFGVLIKTEEEQMPFLLEQALEHVKNGLKHATDLIDWYIAVGNPVNRLSQLSECYHDANRYMAYRFMHPDIQILSEETLAEFMQKKEEANLLYVDSAKMSPEIIRDFLQKGNTAEVHDFVESYLQEITDALKSNMFRDYVVLNVRFTVMSFVESLGTHAKEEYLERIGKYAENVHMKPEEVWEYFLVLIQAAIDLRDKEVDSQSDNKLKRAIEYIDDNYFKESISLSDVALFVDVSSNYLSSLFSQNKGVTFVEYVTEKRMEKAKMLLATTDMSSGIVASEVGYKDSHYFSYVFKKTVGVSPREYRNSKKG